MLVLLLTLCLFTRLEGHAVWINPEHVALVQGAGALGYPIGTLITAGGSTTIVTEDVNQVVRQLTDAKKQCKG